MCSGVRFKNAHNEVDFVEASGIHVGEKQPAIPANLRLDNSFDGLEMFH